MKACKFYNRCRKFPSFLIFAALFPCPRHRPQSDWLLQLCNKGLYNSEYQIREGGKWGEVFVKAKVRYEFAVCSHRKEAI